MKLDFYIVDPTGNITAIVETPVLRESQSRAARLLMETYPEVEQVGFMEKPKHSSTDTAIRMMGGEFCGNAALSAAALYLMKLGADEKTVQLEISGADSPLYVSLCKTEELSFEGVVDMPLPCSVEEIGLCRDGKVFRFPCVHFDGISHLIASGNITREEAEKNIAVWCEELSVDALGILFLDGASMTPLVYVESTASTVWEGSCASGTCAIAAYEAVRRNRSAYLELNEPGGVIGASAQIYEGRISSLNLRNRAKVLGHFTLEA